MAPKRFREGAIRSTAPAVERGQHGAVGGGPETANRALSSSPQKICSASNRDCWMRLRHSRRRPNFATVAAGKKFNPHVTIGVAPEAYLIEMLAEPFEAFTFSPVGAVVYQLGSFGAARKELQALSLNAMSARPTRLANGPLGREIGVHRRASWPIHPTLIIFGLKNAGRKPAGQEDEWAEKSEVKHSDAVGSFDWSKLCDDDARLRDSRSRRNIRLCRSSGRR